MRAPAIGSVLSIVTMVTRIAAQWPASGLPKQVAVTVTLIGHFLLIHMAL